MKKQLNIGAQVKITHHAWLGLVGRIHCPIPGFKSVSPGVVYLVTLDRALAVESSMQAIEDITVHEDYLEFIPETIGYDALAFGEVALTHMPNDSYMNKSIVFKRSDGCISILKGGTRAGDFWDVATSKSLRFWRVNQDDVWNLTK